MPLILLLLVGGAIACLAGGRLLFKHGFPSLESFERLKRRNGAILSRSNALHEVSSRRSRCGRMGLNLVVGGFMMLCLAITILDNT
jgi:hypothetical protein